MDEHIDRVLEACGILSKLIDEDWSSEDAHVHMAVAMQILIAFFVCQTPRQGRWKLLQSAVNVIEAAEDADLWPLSTEDIDRAIAYLEELTGLTEALQEHEERVAKASN